MNTFIVVDSIRDLLPRLRMVSRADRTPPQGGLGETDIRLLARVLAEELQRIYGLQPALLTAADVARQYGLTRAWVYKHAHELGGQRMGPGPKARLRFHPDEVRRRLHGDDRHVESSTSLARRVELLPVGARRLSKR